MVSPRELLSTIEAALLGPSPPTPTQRIELMHAIRSSIPALKSFLAYPVQSLSPPAFLVVITVYFFCNSCSLFLVCGVQGPSASDRAQVESKEVRLKDLPPILLDDTDVQIVSRLFYSVSILSMSPLVCSWESVISQFCAHHLSMSLILPVFLLAILFHSFA